MTNCPCNVVTCYQSNFTIASVIRQRRFRSESWLPYTYRETPIRYCGALFRFPLPHEEKAGQVLAGLKIHSAKFRELRNNLQSEAASRLLVFLNFRIEFCYYALALITCQIKQAIANTINFPCREYFADYFFRAEGSKFFLKFLRM